MTPPKAKDGRETLQERLRRSTARMANECSVRLDLWCEHSSVCLQLANDHDAAQAEIARLTAKYEPGHTDLMVSPESLDAFLAENPLPEGVIRLTPAEIQSGHDRVKWAEGLIRQLPEDHDGRNSWLLNYASAPTPASAVASEAFNRELTEQERQQIIGSGRDAGLEEAAEYHSSEARGLRADAKRYAESNYKPNHELVVPVTRRAEKHEYFARNIRSLKSASTPAPASAQDLVKALEQIRVVCLDNTASERPDLALKFVSEVAEKALSATGGAK